MRKVRLAVELSEPMIVVPLGVEVAEVSTGKFCRLFAPRSPSPRSLKVTLLSAPRSMPISPFAKMLLPKTAFVLPAFVLSSTPSPVLWAIRLPAPTASPPMTDSSLLPDRRMPSRPLPRASVPLALVPM